MGISSHIGTARGRQDHEFEGKPADVVISHIKDLRSTPQRFSIGAPAYTNDQQVFHTDSGDIVSLFALSEAAGGGRSQLASSWKVYNELAEQRPDLIKTLAENWVIDGRVYSQSWKELDNNFEQVQQTRPAVHPTPVALLPACHGTNPRKSHHPMQSRLLYRLWGSAAFSTYSTHLGSTSRGY